MNVIVASLTKLPIHGTMVKCLSAIVLFGGIAVLTTAVPTQDVAAQELTPPVERSSLESSASFSCSTVSEIPQIECAALMDLYISTNGPGWTNRSGWLVTDTPCSWYRVHCDAGHVDSFDLSP